MEIGPREKHKGLREDPDSVTIPFELRQYLAQICLANTKVEPVLVWRKDGHDLAVDCACFFQSLDLGQTARHPVQRADSLDGQSEAFKYLTGAPVTLDGFIRT